MSRDLLIGIGACLVVVGFVMRGLARGSRREQARRRQHDLAAAEAELAPAPDAFDRHLEKWLPRYATASLAVGTLLIGGAFLFG
jgi:hypothetical protein